MDWSAATLVLLEREARPVFVVDAAHRLAAMNTPAKRLTGVPRRELGGRPWSTLAHPNHVKPARWALADARRGAAPRVDLVVAPRGACPLVLEAEAAPVGVGEERGVLLTVLRTRPAEEPEGESDLVVDINVEPAELGSITRVLAPTGSGGVELLGRPCFEVFHRRSLPCEACPVLRAEGRWPHVVVLHRSPSRDAFRVLVERPLFQHVVRATVTLLAEAAIGPLLRARLQRMADDARLTPREREALEYLLLGRTQDEIARLMRISPRTAKFHQTNLLEKLGADSRVDLVRLLL